MNRSYSIKLIKMSVGVLAIVIVVGYAFWRSIDYTRGPSITINKPTDMITIHASTTEVHGRIERAHSITLNGKSIFIDEMGNFMETIIIFPGTNIITLEARDQFKRIVQKRLYLTGLLY